jgi:hypothetical protein
MRVVYGGVPISISLTARGAKARMGGRRNVAHTAEAVAKEGAGMAS